MKWTAIVVIFVWLTHKKKVIWNDIAPNITAYTKVIQQIVEARSNALNGTFVNYSLDKAQCVIESSKTETQLISLKQHERNGKSHKKHAQTSY